jgi:hypothetical protein
MLLSEKKKKKKERKKERKGKEAFHAKKNIYIPCMHMIF